jgi:hypothetical protein
MKQVITKDNIDDLVGRFIVQLCDYDTEDDYSDRFRENPYFWLEKRITFIGRLYGCDGYPAIKRDKEKTSLYINNGIYYTHGIFSKEEFISYFNDYLIGKNPYEIGGKDRKGTRYHRLLTDKELDWLNEELKKKK